MGIVLLDFEYYRINQRSKYLFMETGVLTAEKAEIKYEWKEERRYPLLGCISVNICIHVGMCVCVCVWVCMCVCGPRGNESPVTARFPGAQTLVSKWKELRLLEEIMDSGSEEEKYKLNLNYFIMPENKKCSKPDMEMSILVKIGTFEQGKNSERVDYKTFS